MASSILKYAIVMLFMFSTVYTLAFYWYEAQNKTLYVNPLDDYDGELVNPLTESSAPLILPFSGAVDNIVDFVIEAFSWFSPFALVKGLLIIIVPAEIYQPLNLLLLRPLGWIGTWISTEWTINKIRGSSET